MAARPIAPTVLTTKQTPSLGMSVAVPWQCDLSVSSSPHPPLFNSHVTRTLRQSTPTTLSPLAVASRPALEITSPAGAVGVDVNPVRPETEVADEACDMSRNGEAVEGADISGGRVMRGDGVAEAEPDIWPDVGAERTDPGAEGGLEAGLELEEGLEEAMEVSAKGRADPVADADRDAELDVGLEEWWEAGAEAADSVAEGAFEAGDDPVAEVGLEAELEVGP